jgi:hypothetical protein
LCNGSTLKLKKVSGKENVYDEYDSYFTKGKTYFQPSSKKLSTVSVARGLRRSSEQYQASSLSLSGKANIINLVDCLAKTEDLKCDYKGVVYRVNTAGCVKRYMMVLKNKDLFLLKTSNKAYKQHRPFRLSYRGVKDNLLQRHPVLLL